MSTLEQQQEALRHAVQELGYSVFAALGLVTLAEKLGLPLKPWVTHARARVLLRR